MILNVLPGETFDSIDAWLLDEQATRRPRHSCTRSWRTRLPAGGRRALDRAGWYRPKTTMAHLTREDRRRLVRALLETVVDVRDSRGYDYAEVTAGRCAARRDRSVDDGVARLSGTVPGRGDSGRGRTAGRLQLPVGVVVGVGGWTRAGPRTGFCILISAS